MDRFSSLIDKYPVVECTLQIGLYLTALVLAHGHFSSHGPDPLLLPHPAVFRDVRLTRSDKPWFDGAICDMRMYSNSTVRTCLTQHVSSRFLFVGDSSVRPLFLEFSRLLGQSGPLPQKEDADIIITNRSLGVTLEHRWVNGGDGAVPIYRDIVRQKQYPGFVVQSTSMDKSQKSNMDGEPLKVWSLALPFINDISRSSLFAWIPYEPGGVSGSADSANKEFGEMLRSTHAVVWRSFGSLTRSLQGNDQTAARYNAYILLNWHCNALVLPKSPDCFVDQGIARFPPNRLVSGIVIFLVIAHAAVSFYLKWIFLPKLTDGEIIKKWNGALELIGCVVKLCLIMSYFHLCDRETGVGIERREKEYSHLTFFVGLSVLVVSGFLSLKKSDDVAMLNRNQTEEWKGWMQMVILLYHFTGASKVLPIYFMIRLLVTSYLLLNGYGQFTFFLLKGTFSAMRLTQTFIRLNLLVVLLCFVMGRPYQFYYFVPLVSFWFVVIYCTMGMWPQVSMARIEGSKTPGRWYLCLLAKLLLLAVLMTILFAVEVLFNAMFDNSAVGPLFRLKGSVHEWRFRWQLDRYSVVCGMLLGLSYQYLRRTHLLHDTQDSPLFSRRAYLVITALSALIMFAYLLFSLLCSNKFHCNDFYPYLGVFVVLSFVFLRNLHPRLRTTYSTLYAWVGKISLELFISQYHIWLAEDTHKTLVLVPGFPTVNFLLITLIFVSVCCEIQRITAHLASFFIPRKTSKPPVLPTS